MQRMTRAISQQFISVPAGGSIESVEYQLANVDLPFGTHT
jgi:hypothetical protein